MESLYGRNDLSTSLFYGAAGIFAGFAADGLNKRLNKPLQGANRYIRTVAKLLVPALLLFLIHQWSPRFATDWQSTTPGLFFVSYFFGLQGDLMSDLTKF
jgi:hypothetical protein